MKQGILIATVAFCAFVVGMALTLKLPTISKAIAACSIARIPLSGQLSVYPVENVTDEDGNPLQFASSDEVLSAIAEAESSPSIQGVILEVNSQGGSAIASQEISNALAMMEKPSVAFIREIGVSGGYWSSLGADAIFASRDADVGGIGVLYGYLENSEKNLREGVRYEFVTSGRYKTLGDPNLALPEDARAIVQRDVDILHAHFVEAVAGYRGMDFEKASMLADGSTMLGEMAKEQGLIDEIGNMQDVANYFSAQFGEEVTICP